MARGDEVIAHRSEEQSPEAILYSTFFCPFAQRAWIAVESKGVRYQWVSCKLYGGTPSSKRALSLAEKRDATPGFVECSPRGLVPGLRHGDTAVCESIPVIEYVEEAFPGPALMPKDPAERAKIRIGLQLFNDIVVRRWYGLLMSPPVAWEAGRESLSSGFEEIMALFSAEGPFFSRCGFSLFECACLPLMQRTYSVLKHYRQFSLPQDRFRRLHDWYEACLRVPGFANTVVDEQRLVDSYGGYANNSANNNAYELYRKTA